MAFSLSLSVLSWKKAITQIIEVYIFGGLVFGYNTLTYILKSENLYSHVCPGTYLTMIVTNFLQ